MKKRYIPLYFLPLKLLANLGVIVGVGGGVIIIGWLGAKIISRLISLHFKEKKDDIEAAANTPSVTPPTVNVEIGAAGGMESPNWDLGPEREHNQNHNLQVSLSSRGVEVFLPTYTALDWSFEGQVWYPWTTNLGPDRVEIFSAEGDMMFFRGRGIIPQR